jgi:hypothetical protein
MSEEWTIEYNNDTGPNDEGFWEWIEVGPFRIDFDDRIPGDRERAEGQARLALASKDLLSACEALESKLTKAARAFYGNGRASALREALDGWIPVAEQGRKAIAKARGQL